MPAWVWHDLPFCILSLWYKQSSTVSSVVVACAGFPTVACSDRLKLIWFGRKVIVVPDVPMLAECMKLGLPDDIPSNMMAVLTMARPATCGSHLWELCLPHCQFFCMSPQAITCSFNDDKTPAEGRGKRGPPDEPTDHSAKQLRR